MKQEIREVEKKVIETYQTENPSTYAIEKDGREFESRRSFMEGLFLDRLHFPPKMFQGARLLELGSGTGEHSLFFLRWGAECTFVEANPLANERAGEIFRAFAPSAASYRLIERSLFDFESDEPYDITVSIGVLHHTADKERGFRIQAARVKEGGFTILGVGNAAGQLQRNLQRALLYSFAEGTEELVSLAETLFTEHIDRAEKFGHRSRRAIIFDSYVNPKIDTPTVAEILRWFRDNGLRLYSSWPPIVPTLLGDSPHHPPLNLSDLQRLMSLPELTWLTHQRDDADELREIDRELSEFMASLEGLALSLQDVTPGTRPKIEEVRRRSARLRTLRGEVNPYARSMKALRAFLEELEEILDCVEAKSIDDLKSCLRKTKHVFRGTAGVGMTYFVGRKVASL